MAPGPSRSGARIANDVWAMVIIAVAALIGTLVMVRNHDYAYGVVLLWAFAGILIKHISADGFVGSYPMVITTIIACLVVFVFAGIVLWRRQSPSI